MQTEIPNQNIFLILAIFLLPFLTSCLPEAGTEQPSDIQIGLQIDGFENTFKAGEDSITVARVRLIHGNSFFVRGGDSLRITGQQAQFNFDAASTNPQAILSRTPFPEGTYSELTLKVTRANEGNPNIDSEFYIDKQSSMIIEGTYNGSEFTFKSGKNYTVPFPFQPNVTVPENNESFIFIISTNMSDWFVDEGSQSLLDPGNADNAEAINQNINDSFICTQNQPVEENC